MAPRPILFCATGVYGTVGGIASANRNVLAALERLAAETGRRVETLVLGESGGDRPGYRTFGGDKRRFALAAVMRTLTSDLVVVDHVRLAEAPLLVPALLRRSVAIFAHGSEATWRIRPSSVTAFAKAKLVLTNSQYTLTRMAGYVPVFKGAACPLGLPPQFEVPALPPPPSGEAMTMQAADGADRPLGDSVLLLVSRLDATEREKGHRELIAVLPRLLERFPAAQLVMVGAGSDLEPLRETARASSAAANIFLPGRMVEGGLEAIYRKAFAYVMPSRQEGFGLVYLEAMNYARPCLACHDDGGADVVVDGETGVLAPREFTDDELLEGLSSLLVDRARARRYGEAGWRRLVARFTASAHQDRVAQLIRPLLPGI